MNEKEKPFRKVKVIVRPSPTALKIIVIVLILFSMAALIALRWVTNSIRQETENLREEAAAVEQENSDLKEKIEDLDNIKGVQNIAEEELDMVDPDTVIIDPKPVAGVKWAKGHLDTPRGRINVSWRLENGKLKVEKSLDESVKLTLPKLGPNI